jgi:hypothetical protein
VIPPSKGGKRCARATKIKSPTPAPLASIKRRARARLGSLFAVLAEIILVLIRYFEIGEGSGIIVF